MKNFIFSVWVILCTMFFFSCSESTSTTGTFPSVSVLKAEKTTVSLALSSSNQVALTGGNGSCRIIAMSDSGIVSAFMGQPYTMMMSGKLFQDLVMTALKTGSCIITVQDSAKTSQVKITVNVTMMASSVSPVKVYVGKKAFVHITGGYSPYQIETPPDPLVASIESSGNSSMYVNGINQGNTTVTVRDNASPAHTVTIPIEVITEPKFNSPGIFSFSSTVGDFSAMGISAVDPNSPMVTGEGAGGWLYQTFYTDNILSLIAYKSKDLNTLDIAMLSCVKIMRSAGTLKFDTTYALTERAALMFVLNGKINSSAVDRYEMTDGMVTLTELTDHSAKGTFSGAGVKYVEDKIFPSNTVTVSSGKFDIPLIYEAMNKNSMTKSDPKVTAYLRSLNDIMVRSLKTVSAR